MSMSIFRRNPQLGSTFVATRDKSYETLEMIEKTKKELLEKAAVEVEKVKEFVRAKNKRAAVQCLLRKRLYNRRVELLGAMQLQVQSQLSLMIDETSRSGRDKLYESLDLLEEAEKVLLKLVADEVKEAEKFTRAENERAAIQRLERKKSYEQQLEQIGTIRLLIHDRLTVMITREDGIAIITETIDAPVEEDVAEDVAA